MPVNLSKEKEAQALKRMWDFHYWSRQSRDMNFMPRYSSAMRVYYDQTLDDENKQLLYDRGQSDISINWLRILLRKMQSYMTSNQPQWAAFGVNDDDTRAAKVANAILGHGWRVSYGYLQIVDLLKKGLVGGVGLWSSYVDYKSDNGLGDVKWKSLPIQFFYPDWRSMDQMYDDMSAQQVSFTVDLITAMNMVPKKYHDRLRKLSTVPDIYDTLFQEGNIVFGQHPDPYQTERVRLLTHYQLEERPLWELKDLVDGKTYYLDDRPNIPLPYAVDIKKIDVPSLVKYNCFYGMGEDDGFIFDIEKYPYRKFLIKPFINEFTENPYGIGEAYFLEKLQNYVDKSLRVALQHEMFNANPGIIFPEGSVKDIEEAEQKVMWPGFMLEMDMSDGQRPFFKQGIAGQTGFYNVMNLALEAMRQSTGNMFRPEMARGNATEDQLLKMHGQEQGDALFKQFESMLEAGAEAYLMLSKNHYNYPKVLKFLDKRKKPATMFVNKTFVNEEGELDGFYMSDVNVDIVIATRSYAPTEKFLKVRMIAEAMNRAPGEVHDLLFIEYMKAMEFDPEVVDEAEARMELLPKLMQQLQQMAEAIQELETKNKQLEGQVVTAERSRIRAEYQSQLEVLIKRFKTDMQAATKIWQNKLASNEQIQRKELSNANSGRNESKESISK